MSYPQPGRPRTNGDAILTGPALIKASQSLKTLHDKQAAWPYDWEHRPPGSRQAIAFGSIVAPTQGTQAQILQYNVPDSLQYVPSCLVFEIVGSAWNPGDFLFTLDVNQPIGSVSVQGVPFTGYGAVPFPLGTRQIPWQIQAGENDKLKANDQVRVKVTNVNVTAGSPNYFNAVLLGYTMQRGSGW
jgi:hypothetical protein